MTVNMNEAYGVTASYDSHNFCTKELEKRFTHIFGKYAKITQITIQPRNGGGL